MGIVTSRSGRVLLAAASLLLALVVAGVLYAMFRPAFGRTPPSGFVREAFGSDAVLSDKVYEGGGSSEDRTRTVVIRTTQDPDAVRSEFVARGGWRRLGRGLERASDGLCLVAYAPQDFLATHPTRGADIRKLLERERASVVLALLYC